MPNMIESSKLHKSHPHIVKRLKRVEGHVRSIVAMIEEGRPCLDIAQQLYAVEKAVASRKTASRKTKKTRRKK